MYELPRIWEIFPALCKTIKREHEIVGLINTGHDFDHALRVGQMALKLLWEQDQESALLAGVAGLCHNADRIMERVHGMKSENISEVLENEVEELVQKWLATMPDFCYRVSPTRVSLIIDAVVHHGSKPNAPTDSTILVALTDADRLVNMEADVILRSSQHHYDILAVDPINLENDPEANYRSPRSVLWDIANCITWAAEEGPYILRLPLAKELGRIRAEFLKQFIETLKRQRAELGIIPYPIF